MILPAGEWANVWAANLLILHLSNLRRDVIIISGLVLEKTVQSLDIGKIVLKVYRRPKH